jgi:hypothetical protein
MVPAYNVPLVARTAATLIKTLVQLNLTEIKNIHVLGHSLGAHISGGIGMYMQHKNLGLGVKIPRITGKICGRVFRNIVATSVSQFEGLAIRPLDHYLKLQV